jgi:malonyl CoA-acyl carrier protein transacylase
MTALLGVGAEDAAALCEEARGDDVLVVANENSPAQSVLSGSVPAVERAETLAKERKVRAIRLQVAGAFHSPLMEPAVAPFREALDAIELREPRFPVVSCASTQPFEDVRAELTDVLTRPVRWRETVLAMHEAGGRRFVEVGPGKVLARLGKRILPDGLKVETPELAHA